jgi:hypothetical protein
VTRPAQESVLRGLRCGAVSTGSRTGVARVVIGLARSFVAVALCAQLAHAVLYQSVLPRSGPHGYFSWYLPAVAAAVVAALAALPSSSASVSGRRRSFATLLPERRPGRAVHDVVRLALASGVYFLIQESLERIGEPGIFHLASLSPLAWLALVLALVVSAVAVVALERTLVDLVVRLAEPRILRAVATRWPRLRHDGPRPRPLTIHGALRAPPLTA